MKIFKNRTLVYVKPITEEFGNFYGEICGIITICMEWYSFT